MFRNLKKRAGFRRQHSDEEPFEGNEEGPRPQKLNLSYLFSCGLWKCMSPFHNRDSVKRKERKLLSKEDSKSSEKLKPIGPGVSPKSKTSFRKVSPKFIFEGIIFIFNPQKKDSSSYGEERANPEDLKINHTSECDGRNHPWTSPMPRPTSPSANYPPISSQKRSEATTAANEPLGMPLKFSLGTQLRFPIINKDLWLQPTIWKVRKPQFPLRLSAGLGSRILPRQRTKWIQTTFGIFLGESTCDWRIEPDVDAIADILEKPLQTLSLAASKPTITLLETGGFNKIYTVKVGNDEFIFRLALPYDPYYKLESDVATTEFVRHFTNIPVPRIFAFDSSGSNSLGLEWMLMEKVKGEARSWFRIPDDRHSLLVEQLAVWQHELLQFTCPKIGSLYIRFTEEHMEFYQGPSVDPIFSIGNRPYYGVNRGPFDTLSDYYHAVVEVQIREIWDPAVNLLRESDTLTETENELRERVEVSRDDFISELFHPDDALQAASKSEYRLLGRLTLPAMIMLQENLPRLAEVEVGDVSEKYYLLHDDLSAANIMTDDEFNITAVLDWELVCFSPLIAKRNTYPPILTGQFADDKWEDYDDKEILDSAEESRAAIARLSEKGSSRELEDCYEEFEERKRAVLRRVYRRKLEQLSSVLQWFWEDHYFDDYLKEYVWDAQQEGRLIEWVRSQIENLDVIQDDESSVESEIACGENARVNAVQHECNGKAK